MLQILFILLTDWWIGSLTPQQGDIVADVFGVFDGHGGRDAAMIVSQYAAQAVQRRLGQGSLVDTVREAMLDLSDLVADQLSGLTAVLAVVSGGGVAVANCGDSRAVISRHGVAVQASVPIPTPSVCRSTDMVFFF